MREPRHNELNSVYSVNHLWEHAVACLLSDGHSIPSRDGASVELFPFSATVKNPLLNIADMRRPRLWYAAAELCWYLSGTNLLEQISYYAPQYARFSDNGVIVHGGYGLRLLGANLSSGPLFHVIGLLKAKPDTRQAVVSIWRPTDLAVALEGKCKDIPCTLSLQFLIRQQALHLICTMRSNDVWLGLPYDVYCFTTIQQILAAYLVLEVGIYRHNVGSLHYYERDKEKIKKHYESADSIPRDGTKNLFAYDALAYTLQDALCHLLVAENRFRKSKGKIKDLCGLVPNGGFAAILTNLFQKEQSC